MGSGIAQVALEAGEDVLLHDVDRAALDRARDRIRDGLARRAAKLELDADSIDAWVDGRLGHLSTTLTVETVGGAGLVIEAVFEALDVKQRLFGRLDAAAPPDTVLATNTSALSVGAIAGATRRPDRVLGLHFFNPVPLMRLVEVIVTSRTDPTVVLAAEVRMASWGKTTVRARDTPGFLVNRVNRPFTIEALRILEAGEATIRDVDAAMRDAGYPMGPFELMDLIGLDVNLAAATAIWDGLGRPDHLRPSPFQERLVADGRLGRKSSHGFYRYDDGRRAIVEPDLAGVPGALARSEIVARIEAAVSAEAHRVAGEGIGSLADIDLALRLGAGYPRGLSGE